MPWLKDISYDRQATIAVFRDYYHFLAALYLHQSEAVEPPQDGWPAITAENMQVSRGRRASSLPPELCNGIVAGHWDGEDVKHATQSEGLDFSEDIPSHVVGLTVGGVERPYIFLDVEAGIVHWYECWDKIRETSSQEMVQDDMLDWAPDNETWRYASAAWAILDFFEMLKDQYRQLNFVPFTPWTVRDVWLRAPPGVGEMLDVLPGIYREHGWPDIDRYRKEECLRAVRATLLDRAPLYADWIDIGREALE
ncbi:uncharacterized protein E0L32_008818 [Thyridium curvatum]|uniref:Uncharacterized protein n=1 Tax=Thyridium curvatum TaxID=1093900 RepID=A0A507AYN4_9PEZI|nr:uncharacterized protein E0L32_008818 [Thyridium curvatum]TPX09971.1 hypothetical protein E0L32_008818 [Thyridium curvatum]